MPHAPLTRLGLSLTLVAACGCAAPSERRARDLFASATLAMRRGDLASAHALAERGLTLTGHQRDSERAWTFRLLEAEILLIGNRLAEASPLLTERIAGGAPLDALRARQRFLAARALRDQGKLQEALAAIQEARRLAGAAPPSEQLPIEWLDGQIRLRLERWDEGESRSTAVVARASNTGDRYWQALAMNDLGMSRLRRFRYDAALSWFERVLSLADLEQTTIYGQALSNAGICYSRLGQFERALRTQRRAVERHRGGSPRPLVEALGSLGNTLLLQRDPHRALPYLQEALTVATSAQLMETAAWGATNLAAAYADLGEWDTAEHVNTEARRLNAEISTGRPAYNLLTDADVAAGRGRRDEAAQLYESALAASDGAPDVRWTALAGLARMAIAQKRPAEAARHFEAALATIDKARSDLPQTENRVTFLAQLIRFHQDYVDALTDQGHIELALEIADSSRGRVLAERQRVSTPASARVAAFRRLAQESRVVLLSYWLAPTRSSLWIVTPAGVRREDLPPAKAIEALVKAHRADIDNSLADPLAGRDTAGDHLYRLLVERAARWIPPDASVIIVPDGALHGLNFETLPVDGPRRHYWVEDVKIQIAPSLAMLTARAPSPPPASSLLLIGDATPREPDFPALRYASEEMTGVARHFDPHAVRRYEGAQASPAAFRDAHPDRFAMIHFTAHAVANVESPLDSAVILSGPDGAFKLYARDVAEQQLRADLVTVSACRSAGERAYSGEGLIGFAWAFLRAGAQRVVAGLWDVDDQSTARLMDLLYQRLAAGDPPARALRDAKLTMLREGGRRAKPYYWASFQLFTAAP